MQVLILKGHLWLKPETAEDAQALAALEAQLTASQTAINAIKWGARHVDEVVNLVVFDISEEN